MRVVILLAFFASICAAKKGHRTVTFRRRDSNVNKLCSDYSDVLNDYRKAFYNFAVEYYLHGINYDNAHFALSPLSMIINLAAIAEGADEATQKEIFSVINFPEDPCKRQKYYTAATSRYSSTDGINTISKRALVINDGVTVNPKWQESVTKYSLLEITKAPIKKDKQKAAKDLRTLASARAARLNLSGNSVVLDTLDFNNLWTTLFADAIVEKAPFYSLTGQQIGSIDLMRVKRRAKIGYSEKLRSKLLEFPIEKNGRYSLIIGQFLGNESVESIKKRFDVGTPFDVLQLLQDTVEPIDIAIPRFTINSEIDVKTILEYMGVKRIWTDPAATRHISDPPALPSSYIQRTTVTISNEVANPSSQPDAIKPRIENPQDEGFLKQFTADSPFMFVFCDTETWTGFLTGMFTEPTYPIV